METVGEVEESERCAHWTWFDAPHHSVRHPAAALQRRRDRSGARSRTRPPCATAHSEGHLDAGGDHVFRILAYQPGASLRHREGLVRGARAPALRFCQLAAHRAGRDASGISADAGLEYDLTPPDRKSTPSELQSPCN